MVEVQALKVKNRLFTKLTDIVEIFNKHFSTVGCKLGQRFSRVVDVEQFPLKTNARFSLTPVSERFVYEQMLHLKPNKAIGLDKISSRLLKDGAEVIAPILTKIINCSFNQKTFPQYWKSAKVMALFKSSDSDDCNNYRPISILPTISKIVERAAHMQLYNYLDDNSLLYMRQFGFRRKRSTSSALLQFTDDILGNMEHGQVTGVVFLDLKKAFDTVNHRVLILKLRALGVDDFSFTWFKSYLSNRTQRTVMGNAISSPRSVNKGIPQGSVLGPLFFLVYINDLAEGLKSSKAALFADNTAIYCSASSAADLQLYLDEDLKIVKNWMETHKLTLNVSKTKLMVIGGRQRLSRLDNIELSINESIIDHVDKFKYLGIIINETLDWSEHIDHIQSKVAKRLGLLKRVKHLLPVKSRELVYKTMIQPILEYL